jgi:biotin transport system permease protein
MGSLYSEHPTWLHRVTAGWKLALLLVLSTGVFWLESLHALGIGCAVAVVLFASLGAAMRPAFRLLKGLGVAALLILMFHALMQQTMVGMVSVLRMTTASLLSIAFTLTTRSADLQGVVERLLQPLAPLGVRADRFALQIALMLRFIEHFFVVWKRLDDSHRLRTGKGGGIRLLAPLTLSMLQTARRVADTLDLRLGK